jgi:hypothetical protein
MPKRVKAIVCAFIGIPHRIHSMLISFDQSPSSADGKDADYRSHDWAARPRRRAVRAMVCRRFDTNWSFTRSGESLPVSPSQLSRATSIPPDEFRGQAAIRITRLQSLGMTQQHVNCRLEADHPRRERGSRIESPPNAKARKCKMI